MTFTIKQIKNIDWYVFHKRNRSPFFCEMLVRGINLGNKKCPVNIAVRPFGSIINHVSVNNLEKIRVCNEVIKQLKKDPTFLLKIMNNAYKDYKLFLKRWKIIENKDLTKLSNKKLINILDDYTNDLLSYGIYLILPLLAEDYLEEFLRQQYKLRFDRDADKWFSTTVHSIKDSTVLKEEISLLKCKNIKDLTKHTREFKYMKNTGFTEDYFDLKYYQDIFKEIKNKKTRLKELQIIKIKKNKKFSELLNSIKDDKYLSAITKTVNEAVFFRGFRTEIFYQSAPYYTGLFKEISNRIRLKNYKDLVYFSSKEIKEALKHNKINQKLISQRKKGFIFIADRDKQTHLLEGKYANKVFSAFLSALKKHKSKEIKGMAIFVGKIKGTVKVVHNLSELKKIKNGDILVTHATNVNFVPVLRKVKAIITEEGGILSHASIISRELNIPCLINTKIATKVLKDGDYVEIDADKGVVRKIR